MAKSKPEKLIQDKILRWLNSRTGCWAVKFPGIWIRGVPDIICCYYGQFYAFEVKGKDGKATPIQLAVIEQINKCHGEAHVVRSLDEVKEILKRD